MAIPVTTKDQASQIAMVSSNNDADITSILTEIYEANRQQMSAISIGCTEKVYHDRPKLEFLKGYSFEQGFLSPYFATDNSKTIVEYGSA